MSRETIISCDANGCSRSLSYSGTVPVHAYLRHAKWHEAGGYDYCPGCWPAVLEELKELEEDDE
jgi:hypothetical protein